MKTLNCHYLVTKCVTCIGMVQAIIVSNIKKYFYKKQIYFILCVDNLDCFSIVLRNRGNSDVFNTLDEIYIVFASNK